MRRILRPKLRVAPSRRLQRLPGPAPTGRVRATPLVRKIAQELGVDLATVAGTGANGQITEADVRAAAGGQSAEEDGGSRSAASGA